MKKEKEMKIKWKRTSERDLGKVEVRTRGEGGELLRAVEEVKRRKKVNMEGRGGKR